MNKQSLMNVLFSPPSPSCLFPFGVDSFPSLPFPTLISSPRPRPIPPGVGLARTPQSGVTVSSA